MKKNTVQRYTSVVAGLLFYFSAYIYLFQKEDLFPGISLALSGTLFLVQGFMSNKSVQECSINDNVKKGPSAFKIFGVTFGVVVVMFGLGFAVGNLLAHFVN